MNDLPNVFPPLPPHMVGVSDRGRAIYAETIRPLLTDADKGKYLIINVETGEWVMNEDYETNTHNARARFHGQRQYGMRIGYRGVFAMRAGMNLELESW